MIYDGACLLCPQPLIIYMYNIKSDALADEMDLVADSLKVKLNNTEADTK